MLALILAVAAGVALGLGWLLESIVLVYTALGLSGLGLVYTAVRMWLRRRRARQDNDVEEDCGLELVANEAENSRVEADDAPAVEARPLEQLTDDSLVLVVAGRKRFHLDGCRLLDQRALEELTLAEAQDESFTPCSVCIGGLSAELTARA